MDDVLNKLEPEYISESSQDGHHNHNHSYTSHSEYTDNSSINSIKKINGRVIEYHTTQKCKKCDNDDRKLSTVCYCMIYPLLNLVTFHNQQGIKFQMRRKNKIITLQWETFSGSIGQTGINFLSVGNFFTNLPVGIIAEPIYIEYKNIGRITHVEINPFDKKTNIKFYLNTDSSAENINHNDSVKIYGKSISWILE